MATLSTQQMGPAATAGVTPSYSAANGGGDAFTPGSDTFVHVKNGGTASLTITFVTPYTAGTLPVADPGHTVAGGAEKMIGPFPSVLFADYTNSGLCSISYNQVNSVTLGVFSNPMPVGS